MAHGRLRFLFVEHEAFNNDIAGKHIAICTCTKYSNRLYVRTSSTNIVLKSSGEAAELHTHHYTLKTMTRSGEEIARDEHIDQKLLVEYIKNDLFQKAKFVLGEDEWDVGGMIYNDYIKCCRGRIGLQTMR